MRMRYAYALASLSVLFSLESYAIQPLSDFISASQTHAISNKIAKTNIDQRSAEADQRFYGSLLPLPALTSSIGYTYNPSEGVAVIPGERTSSTVDPSFVTDTARRVVVIPHNQFDIINTLRVPIFDLEAIFRYQAAKQSHKEAIAEASAENQRVAAQVAQAYFQYVIAASVEAAVEERISGFVDLVSVQKSRAQIGANFEFDTERAQQELDRAILSKKEINVQKNIAKRVLEKLSGLSVVKGTQDAIAIPTLKFVLNDGTPEFWLKNVGGLPAVLAAERAAKVAEANSDAANMAYVPKISGTLGNRITNAAGFQEDPVIWSAGVTASMNFDFGMPFGQKAQKAAASAANLRIEQTKVEARDSILSAYDQIDLQLERYLTAQNAQLLAVKMQANTGEKYAAGTGSLIEAMQAEQNMFVAKMNKIQAYAELEYARVLLRITAGRDLADRSQLPPKPMDANSKKTGTK